MGYRIGKDIYNKVNKIDNNKCTYCLDILNEDDSYDHTLIDIFMDMRDIGEKGNFLSVSINGDVYEGLELNQNKTFKNATKSPMGNKYQKIFDIKRDSKLDFKWDCEAHIKKVDKIWEWLIEMLENSGKDFHCD